MHYIRFGEGPKTLLCFHGYEQDSSMYTILGDKWRSRFTIYSFDIYHHGASVFPSNRIPKQPISKDEFKNYFKRFLKHNEIESFSIMGYSLGSRMALAMAFIFRDKVESLYLFAPDGLKKMPLQHFIEHNRLGILLFQHFVAKPQLFHTLVRMLFGAKILPKSLHDFVMRKTTDYNQRKLLFDSWQTLKRLHLKPSQIKEINQSVNEFLLVFGKYDSVIPTRNLKQHSFHQNQIIVLDKTHDLFDVTAITVLESKLKF